MKVLIAGHAPDLAVALLREGARVALAAGDAEYAARVGALPLPGDVAAPADAWWMAREAEEQLGGLDALVLVGIEAPELERAASRVISGIRIVRAPDEADAIRRLSGRA